MSVALFVLLVVVARLHRALLARLGAGTLFHIARLPGNLLHECAHAVAALACGYTISGFTVSLFDPAGRGGVRPGPPWTSLARPWLADLVSPVAPLVAGVAALVGLGAWAGIPGLPVAWAGVPVAMRAVPWQEIPGGVALALALPIAAEMLPSDIDLRAWARPAFVVAALLAVAAWIAERQAPGTVGAWLAGADGPLQGVLARALALLVWSTIPWAPILWLAGRFR